MKTLQLHREYSHISQLCKEDGALFTKLLKGGNINRYLKDLCIMPADLNSKLTCINFVIEHHQLFRSKSTNQWYLVFYPLPYLICRKHFCTYSFMEDHRGYFFLHREHNTILQEMPPFGNMLVSFEHASPLFVHLPF